MKLSIDIWLIQVFQRLASNDPTLTEFHSDGKKAAMGDDGAAALAVCLSTNYFLKKLDLSHSRIGPVGMKAIARSLLSNTSIDTIILDGNKIGKKGAVALSPVLKKPNSLITELSLFGCGIGAGGAKAVVSSLTCNKTIRKLNLGDNDIGNDGVSTFAENFGGDVSLKELDLSYNNIDKWGVFAISFWLHENVSVQFLRLSGNDFGPAGALTLGKLLKVDWTLKELELNDCDIGNEGFVGLVNGLRHNESLTHLFLRANGITNEAISMFQDVLNENQGVEVLVMDSNESRDDGFHTSPARFNENQTLQELELYFGVSVNDFVLTLINDLQYNTSKQSQCFDENRVDVELVQAVSTVLEESSNLTLTKFGVSRGDIGSSDVLEITSVIADENTLEGIEVGPDCDSKDEGSIELGPEDEISTELGPKDEGSTALKPEVKINQGCKGLRYLCLADNPIGSGGLSSHIKGLPYHFFADKLDLYRLDEEGDTMLKGEMDLYHRWNKIARSRCQKGSSAASLISEFYDDDRQEFLDMVDQDFLDMVDQEYLDEIEQPFWEDFD